MKKSSKAVYYLYSFILSAAVMLASTAILAFLLLKSGMGNGLVGVSAAAAAFVSALVGSVYSGKATNNPYGALVSGGILLGVLTCISLGMARSEYSIPFAVPLCCAAGGIIPFIALSKASSNSGKKVKKLIKRRRSLN
ncbi:MAG: hypothetical protein PHW77_06055 [Eubacteriales bacterium]|nr:hypothetical protein [Eubacteriales bacterium]